MRVSDEDVEKRLLELRDKGAEHAQAEAKRGYLEDFKKAKLAILMKEAEQKGFKTAAAQEREALADQQYEELLKGLQAATEKSMKLKWELESIRTRLSVWQTDMANRRVEQSTYNRTK